MVERSQTPKTLTCQTVPSLNDDYHPNIAVNRFFKNQFNMQEVYPYDPLLPARTSQIKKMMPL